MPGTGFHPRAAREAVAVRQSGETGQLERAGAGEKMESIPGADREQYSFTGKTQIDRSIRRKRITAVRITSGTLSGNKPGASSVWFPEFPQFSPHKPVSPGIPGQECMGYTGDRRLLLARARGFCGPAG